MPPIPKKKPPLRVAGRAGAGSRVVVASKARPVKPKTPYGITMPPRPSYNAQQQSILDAWKVVQPQINAATAASLRSGEAGQGAIRGYTAELAKALSGYNPGEIYGRAQQSLAAISQGVQGDLTAGGQKVGGDLAKALAAINAPAETMGYATQQGTIGQQSGAAQYGLGSADMEAITKSRAAAEDYAGKLPGIAGFAGLQSARALELQRSAQLADTVGGLTAQVPGLVQQRYGEIKQNQQQRQEFAYKQKQDTAKARSDAVDRAREDAVFRAEYGLDLTKESNRNADQNADRVSRERVAAANRQAANARAAAGRAAQAAKDATSKATKDAAAAAAEKAKRSANFYATKARAVADAQAAFGAGATPAQVRAALWANYGATLMGQGWARNRVEQMIENAIKAGRATPKKTGAGKTTPGKSLVP